MAEKPVYIVVTPFFPTPESWRGAFCYDFVRALIRTGKYDVRVFVHWDGRRGNGSDYEYNGVKVYRFRFRLAPSGLVPFLYEPINRRSFLRKARAVGIDWGKVAVYHAHEPLFCSYVKDIKKKYPSIKTALHFHSGPLLHLKTGRLGIVPIHATLLYLYYRWLHEMVDVPIFVSARQRRLYGSWYRDGYLRPTVDIRDDLWIGRWLRSIKMKPSIVMYNGFDSTVFNPKGRVEHQGFVIGCVGNFTPEKDQITLIKAIDILRQNIPKIRCILIGSGQMLDACKEYVINHNLTDNVKFRREIDHLLLPDFYRSLDLFVLPSWIEGFCCSYIEAFGCGTSFMGCKGVSVEEAFDTGARERWLFEPKNEEELARKIKAFYQNRYKQVLSRNFDIDDLMEEFLHSI